MWLVTGYDEAATVLKDKRFAMDWRNIPAPEEQAQAPPISKVVKLLKSNMLYRDPPDHTRLRALVSGAFTSRPVERARGRVQQIADALLDAARHEGEMDLVADYAIPLSFTVLAELLGTPAEDQDKLSEWIESAVSGDGTGEYIEEIVSDMRAFTCYLRAMLEEKRKNPEGDLVSALVQAEEAGDVLGDDELVGMVLLLLIAGHLTTADLIGTGVLALLQHPGQLQKLKDAPSLIEPAVEELLRHGSPLERSTERFAREDVAVGGTVIPKGETVLVVIAAANRDPERFPDPDVLDITRADNKHLAFGNGIHRCPGAPLGRMEARIAIATLLRRMPNLRLKGSPEELTWRPGLLFRGLRRLPVEF